MKYWKKNALYSMILFALCGNAFAVTISKENKIYICDPKCSWKTEIQEPEQVVSPTIVNVESQKTVITPQVIDTKDTKTIIPNSKLDDTQEDTISVNTNNNKTAKVDITESNKQVDLFPVIRSNQSVTTNINTTAVQEIEKNQGRIIRTNNAEQLDIWKAVRLAVENYPSIRGSRYTLSGQQSGVDAARAGYFPTIKASMNTGDRDQYGRTKTATLSASQTLYDFGKTRNAVKTAEGSVETQKIQLMAEMDSIAYQTGNSVIGVQRYSKLVATAQKQVDEISKLLKLAEQKVGVGAATRADLTQALSRLEGAQATLSSNQVLLSQWHTNLQVLLGASHKITVKEVPLNVFQDQVASLKTDLKKRLDIMLAESELETAKSQVEQAKSNYFPTVSVDASYDRFIDKPTSINDKNNFSVMVNVSQSLFEGGGTTARYNAAQYTAYSANERVKTMYLEGKNRLASLRQEINGLRQRMSTLSNREKTIVETRKLYQDQYLSLGTRSLLDLLNAEQEIYSAEVDRINAEHDLMQSQLSYIQATGYMRDVFELDSLLVGVID